MIFILGFFWSFALFCGIVEPKESKRIEEVKKTIADTKLGAVNARLKVEGATFRQFNLYFPPIKESLNPSVKTKAIEEIRSIIERDLQIVGGFSMLKHTGAESDALLKQKGAEGIAKLSIGVKGDRISASIEHKNLMTGKKSFHSFSGDLKGIRRLSHLISQSIYQEFIGPEDIFLLQIAAVKLMGKVSQIVLLDFDGQGEQILTTNNWSKASPYFSPDGKNILYTVISPEGQGIVEQEVGKSNFEFRIKKPGLNLDGRILPNNSGMLATLSYENNANIYLLTRSGSIKNKLTQGVGMNLSPSISSDGKEMAFVSSRSGNPQIYVQALGGENTAATRLTFQGKYNQTPSFSPDGKFIAFTGRDENKVFDIFLVERATGRVSRITQNQGRNQEPFFSPSGRFVIFTSEREGKSKPDIFIASTNGDHQFRLTNADSDKKSLGYNTPVIRPKM
jgi:TolB protein